MKKEEEEITNKKHIFIMKNMKKERIQFMIQKKKNHVQAGETVGRKIPSCFISVSDEEKSQ